MAILKECIKCEHCLNKGLPNEEKIKCDLVNSFVQTHAPISPMRLDAEEFLFCGGFKIAAKNRNKKELPRKVEEDIIWQVEWKTDGSWQWKQIGYIDSDRSVIIGKKGEANE